jgi:site-specific DNA-methyltransferase (adenine-specific)
MNKVLELDPTQIEFGWRARLDCGDINDLAGSITKMGQLQPAVVMERNGHYELIAGARRIQACEQLGRKIEVVVKEPANEAEALEMQIDENRARKDFDHYELSRAIHRLKELYEVDNPDTKHGATGRGRPKPKDAPPAFKEACAEKLKMSIKAVQECVQIANLPAKIRKKIEGTDSIAERNKLVHEALQQIRRDNKLDQLKRDAAQREKDREQVELDEQKRQPIHVYHEDALELMDKLPKESVDLVLTDPPYERARSSIAHIARAGINPKDHAWDKLDVGWVMRAAPLLVPGGQLLTFCPLEKIGDYEVACGAAGLDYRMSLIWCRTNPGPAHRPTYVSAAEAIVWAVKPGRTPYFKPWEGKGTDGDYHPMNWFDSPICGGKERLHPTQKPLAVILKLLARHSSADLDHRVLDPFAGAGTTGVACRQLNQTCILVECQAEYIEMIKARLQAAR